MGARDAVLELVKRFARDREQYMNPTYLETHVRREFIDPFFKALGWDIDNSAGYAPQYRDVVHEDSIKVGIDTRAPDYSFRIGGVRKFFVEAKKPSVNLKDDPAPAYQLRRYAWSAKLPLSVVTDFQEFVVYDCRVKPAAGDKASVARTLYVPCEHYGERWDDIASVFGKDAILTGSFDKYAESSKAKRGTAEVDKAFLSEIESWRDELARGIALRNPSLSTRELNYAVQVTIDRIIFLRICEDRRIEGYGELQSLLNGGRTYARLQELFIRADQRYNSGLFHFESEKGRNGGPDRLTPTLTIDDKVLKGILRRLYYPDSPYEFSVLPADILGQVYEQFLGKVIRLTAGHRAVVEDKPEVKKAGGVYYTPTYIVDYIVENTVGRLLEGATPAKASELRICDPACGSGSFLIGAYQYLLDWHRDWYVENGGEKAKKEKRIYEAGGGEWRLTTAERKRILLNSIFGVDIDAQAVETTKLSLLLKVLEGETSETLNAQMSLIRERALPDLSANIKCGNSLIGPDFYDEAQMGMSLFDDEERYRINVFDWEAEFPEILGRAVLEERRGFDAVIGNPPYIDSTLMTKEMPDWRTYCRPRYEAASGNWDLFCLFVEKGLQLAKRNGLASQIVPNKLGSTDYAAGARRVLTAQNSLVSIRDYSGVRVFPVAVYPIVYVARRAVGQGKSIVLYDKATQTDSATTMTFETAHLSISRHFSIPGAPWAVFAGVESSGYVSRLCAEYPPLSSVADVVGAATVSEAYQMKPLIVDMADATTSAIKVVNSGVIDRYATLWGQKSLRYLGDSYAYPGVPEDLLSSLPPKRLDQARTPKIIFAGMTKRLECMVDIAGDVLAAKSTSLVFSDMDLRYLTGLLNSRLLNSVFESVFGGNKLQGGYLRIGPPQLRTLPIRTIDLGDRYERAKHDRMVELVVHMLGLNARLARTKAPHERVAIVREIDAADRMIDRLVYDLYHLTDAEIALVEAL